MAEERTTPAQLFETAGQSAHSRWSYEYELDPATHERTGRIRDAQVHSTLRRLAIPPSERKSIAFT